ncbi:MAG: hypothetical protein OEV87_10630, partial [Phycisphaerae bacterium]|nr:hypothetical protein [Phycisphaerae bacterium]
PALNNLHRKRAFFTISDINFRPISITQCLSPFADLLKRLFGGKIKGYGTFILDISVCGLI